MCSTAAAAAPLQIAPPDSYTRMRRRKDGPTFRSTGATSLSAPPSAVSWSPHNVLCIAVSTQLQFYIRDCQRPLCSWMLNRIGSSAPASNYSNGFLRSSGLRQVAWAPGLRQADHYPAACWIAALTDAGLHVAVVQRHGDRVEVLTQQTAVTIPSDAPSGHRRGSDPADAAWVRQVEWVDAETLLVLLSTRALLLHLPTWEAATIAARGTRRRTREGTFVLPMPASSTSSSSNGSASTSSSAATSSSTSNSTSATSSDNDEEGNDALAPLGFSRVITPKLQFTETFEAAVVCRAPADTANVGRDAHNAVVLLTQGTCYCYLPHRPPQLLQQQQLQCQSSVPQPLHLQFQAACALPSVFHGVSINAAAGHRIPPNTSLVPAKHHHPPAAPVQSAGAHRPSTAATGQLPPPDTAGSVCTLCLVVCYPATVAHFTIQLNPHGATEADGIRLIRAFYWPSHVLDDNVGWLSVVALAAIPITTADSAKDVHAAPLPPSAVFRCVYLVVGCRSLLGIAVDVVLDDGTMATLQRVPADASHLMSQGPDTASTVLWKCPRVHGIHYPAKDAAVQLVGVAVHSSFHVVGTLVRIHDDSGLGMHVQLQMQSMRDPEVCAIARFCDALHVWKHYAHCLTTYPRDSYAAREYILADTCGMRSLAYYHERRLHLMLLGAGAPVDVLSAAVVHVQRCFIDEAQRSMQSLVQRYLNNRCKYGPELMLKQGWIDNPKGHSSSSTFHWRTALVALLRTFELSASALELAMGAALLGLHGWCRWSQRNFLSGVRPASLPHGFCCTNAVSFLEAYVEALSSDDLNLRQQRAWRTNPSGHPKAIDGVAFPSAILRGAKAQDAAQFAEQLRAFLVSIDVERKRQHDAVANPPDEQFWPPTSTNRCSVCLAPLIRSLSVPLSLSLDTMECTAHPVASTLPPVGSTAAKDVDVAYAESHTTVFSPQTFEPLGLYDSNALIARCSCCSFFQAVEGATCVLCDAILK